ncbi:hypothetical protein JHK85_057113 [Glycine max]|nr:hypothetical protein JHK85_057113 [Glycine max]
MATFSIGTHTCPCSSICIILDFHFMASAPLNHHPSLAPLPAESVSQNLTPESGSCDPLCSLDETSSQEFEDSYQPKTDFLKAVAILAAAATGALTINHSWVATNQDLAMALLFVIGYAGIIFEESPAFNKSGVGLLMTVAVAVCLIMCRTQHTVNALDASTPIYAFIFEKDKEEPIRTISMYLAPSTDIAVSELTHASVEVSEIVFFLLGAMTIVEIVDAHQGFKVVTGNITTQNPRLLWMFIIIIIAPRGQLVFSVGLGALIFVPVFKALAGLPPYMGMLLGLCVLWILTDAIHYGESESLEAAGILREIANYLDAHVPSSELIASSIGLISALIDNVPLVADGNLIAFCAGTGGSMLIIGSAAGVAFMEDGKGGLLLISGFAFAGYAAGIVPYLALHNLNISLPTLAEVPFLSGS